MSQKSAQYKQKFLKICDSVQSLIKNKESIK